MNKESLNEATRKTNEERKQQLEEMDQLLEAKKAQNEELKQSLEFYKREFLKVQDTIQKLTKFKKAGMSKIKAIPAYALGRRNIKQVYSKTYKQKNAANKLKKYNYHLYDLGFEERASSDLQTMLLHTKDPYFKKAIAWELGLWYANKLTDIGAKIALDYIELAMYKVKDLASLRKAAILKAEAYDLLGEPEEGRRIVGDLLKNQIHGDLYLAAANLEATSADRLKWINKTLKLYGLQEVKLSENDNVNAYYNLTTDPIQQQGLAGPKVSVIIPAYNSESGIRVAIESVLAQTWNNLEVLVVDDCSTDHTPAIIAEYAERDRRVKPLQTPVNSGAYTARNIALKEAIGEFITINDADDWSHPEKIEKQVRHLIEEKDIIANTSEHARLTEDLKLYRRGMPGQYIFSNMSSIMFRREPVVEKVGYWDSIRFAADSEFKRRLEAVFGKDKLVDLKTGPLSFPMQSSGSLTGNSAFGYSGFLMGIRKEYAEAYRFYHKEAKSLYFPFPQKERPFPVPEPMWPKREEKVSGRRHLDIIMISDFRTTPDTDLLKQIELYKYKGLRTGLIQMSQYDAKIKKEINPSIRKMIDGEHIQMLVYGESVACDILIVHNPAIFQEKQKYVPTIFPRVVRVIITELPHEGKIKNYTIRQCARHIGEYVTKTAKWYPVNQEIRMNLMENHHRELKSIQLSTNNWPVIDEGKEATFISFIENWMVEANPFILE
ncbi:glycosyltransferase [Oceanobacillus saliphilus]|uniref:glycosyltransferase n=1 Tax=Oceanobacillus saliphilus TaxID=2925834 RepID=UPI00201DB029|nr:glycosyltransferase [Oceanobacillus saliphilus]